MDEIVLMIGFGWVECLKWLSACCDRLLEHVGLIELSDVAPNNGQL